MLKDFGKAILIVMIALIAISIGLTVAVCYLIFKG